MQTLSFAQVLDSLLLREKTAEISTSPRTFFVHVRVPDHVVEDLRAVQKRVIPDASKHQDIDHVTLVYTKKPLEDHPPDKVHAALEALRQIGEKTEPVSAKIQGWGYFDGASKDGKTTTALVALLDAPGLEHLHVDMVRALKDLGVTPSDNHVFTPHITLGYLGEEGRVDTLPKLSGSFTIDKAHVASRDHHEVPLKGTAMSMGQKAASFVVKDAARAGMRQIQQHIGAGNIGAANRLATTPGVLKPSAAGSQIRQLGAGVEGAATLVAHPEHGIAVRKMFDPQGTAGPEMVANKAQVGRALQGNPNVARFLGETPTQIGPAHFSEYVHGTPTKKSPAPLPSLGGETPAGHGPADVAASVRGMAPALGMKHMHDVGEHNMITTPSGQHKVIDYMPLPQRGPSGLRMDVIDRGDAARAAHAHGMNHAFSNYIADPARPGNLMAQAFRGAKPLVQEHSPPQNPKWASLGEKAARDVWEDKLPGGKADDKTPSDFDPKQLAKGEAHEREHTKEGPLAREIAMDHLSEDRTYYDKLEKIEKKASLGEAAAAFAMNPRDVQVQRRDAPGKGTTTPSIGGVPLQGSC